VVALGRLGWSLRGIEAATAVRRETASDYLKAAGVPVRARGGRPRAWPPEPATTSAVSTDSPSKPATTGEVSTDVAPVETPSRAPTASACEPYRELIAEALRHGRNAMAIWQDLVDDHGFEARYTSVRRFIVSLRSTTPAEARVVITTAPGEEAQVDYGEGPMVRDPGRGKYRRTRLFVLTLGYSRKSVRLLVWRSSARTWAELHERAFRRLGGTVRVVILDNLKEGVLTPDIYDPTLNPLYRDVLAHYGAVALPCRVRDPDRKGKVEAGVGHAQKTPLRGQRFESLEAAQAYLDRWETHWADTRIHGTSCDHIHQHEGARQNASVAERRETGGPVHQRPGGPIGVLDVMPATGPTEMLPEERAGGGVEQADEGVIPLHVHPLADPARRRAVISPRSARCRWSRFATTSTASAPCISMAAWKSTRRGPRGPTSPRRPRPRAQTRARRRRGPRKPPSTSACRPIAFCGAIWIAGRRCP
jgi:transposase